jgi:hypothetical protein
MLAPQFALDATARLAGSALPDAPVVPYVAAPVPGRTRIALAVTLRRAADQLAGERRVLAAR